MNRDTSLTPAGEHRQAQLRSKASALLLLALGLALCSQGTVLAGPYHIQPIARVGDRTGDLLFAADGAFNVGALNDRGQFVFTAVTSTGSQVLMEYDGGGLTPLAVADKAAPGGMWSHLLAFETPVSINQSGNVAFAANVTSGASTDEGTYLWDALLHKVTPVALAGMPAGGNSVLVAGGVNAPVVNNSNEVVLAATVKDSTGQLNNGIYLHGPDLKLQPVVVPGQNLPDGGQVGTAARPSLNDSGVIGFRVQRAGGNVYSGYFWEQGTLTPVVQAGAAAPGGGKFATVRAVVVNNANRSVLVGARLNDRKVGPESLYRFVDGKLIAVAVPGQEMPGGGKFDHLQSAVEGISSANDAGQHAFLAHLADGTTAAYLLNADGTMSLILKEGMTTDVGVITSIGEGPATGNLGIGLNSKGQVVFSVTIAGGAGETIVLLTPSAP